MTEAESDSSVEVIHEKRLFVGGLFPNVKDDDLKCRFGRFGLVKGIEIKVRKDSNGNPVKTFAYIDLETNDRDFKKCVRMYNKTKWKGSELKIQVAKEDFMKKLKKEREDSFREMTEKEIPNNPVSGIQSKLMAISDIATAANFNMRGAVPGTLIPGEEKWVVGKYGRVLPIVHLKKTGASKILKIDPSKLSHNIKRIKDDEYVDDVNPNKLTWQLEECDNELSKKRKGEFPEWPSKVKRKRNFKNDISKHDMRQKLLDKVESDKSYRNSDFEVVPLEGNIRGIPKSDKIPKFNKTKHNVDNTKGIDSSDNEIDMVRPSANYTAGSYIDLSRFDSDSEEDLSKDSFRKTVARQFTQVQNKSLRKLKGQIFVIQDNALTNTKGIQSSKMVLESSPEPKKNDKKDGLSSNHIDEYSNGLNNTINNRIYFFESESDGYDSENEFEKSDDDGSIRFDDGDYSSDKQNTYSSFFTSKNISQKPNWKPTIVEGKKTLLAFHGTKFLTSDTNVKAVKAPQRNKESVEDKEKSVDCVACLIQEETKYKSKGKVHLKVKKQPVDINFKKSYVKRACSEEFVNPKFLSYEFASGLDMAANYKNDVSSEEDEEDSDFIRYAKNEMAKIESRKKSSENANIEQSKEDEKNAFYFHARKEEDTKKVYHNITISTKDDDTEEETKTSFVHLDGSEVITGMMNAENRSKQDCFNNPLTNNCGGRMDENDSCREFETLISKAVQEAHGINAKALDSISVDLPKSDEYLKKLDINNEYIGTKDEEDCSSGSESAEESSEVDTDKDNDMIVDCGKVLDHSSYSFNLLKTNHNRNLNISSQMAYANNDYCSTDKISYESNDDAETNIDKKNLIKCQKSQTLDYSGMISESSESDNDILVETESDRGEDRSILNSNIENIFAGKTGDITIKSLKKDSNELKAKVKKDIKDNNKNEASDSCNELEDESSESDISMDVDMNKGRSESQNKTNTLKTAIKQGQNAKLYSRDFTKESVCHNVSETGKQALNLNSSKLSRENAFHGPSRFEKYSTREIKTQVKLPQLENKAEVDKRRLAAVKKRQREALAQKYHIKNALLNLDTNKSVNTKIKFESDSAYEQDEQVAVETGETVSAVNFQGQNVNEFTETKKSGKSTCLFDSDDNSDEGDNDNDASRFYIREEFEGVEGRKLAKLQSGFGHDARFRLDARFKESGSEDDEKKIMEEDDTTRSLKILQSVVGIKALSGVNKQDKAKKIFKDVGALKYDPTCEKHKQFEVESKPAEQPKPDEKKKKKKGKMEAIAMVTETEVVLPEVTKEKFYEISDSLKMTFVEKAKAPTAATSSELGFSLLAAFGTQHTDYNAEKANKIQDSARPIPEVLRANQLPLCKRFNVRDDINNEGSDEESDDEKKMTKKEQQKTVKKMDTTEQTTKQASVITKQKNFFFLPNDEKLKEFRSQIKENSNQGDWCIKRRYLIESYKSKHKNLRRKKGPMKKRGGKR